MAYLSLHTGLGYKKNIRNSWRQQSKSNTGPKNRDHQLSVYPKMIKSAEARLQTDTLLSRVQTANTSVALEKLTTTTQTFTCRSQQPAENEEPHVDWVLTKRSCGKKKSTDPRSSLLRYVSAFQPVEHGHTKAKVRVVQKPHLCNANGQTECGSSMDL